MLVTLELETLVSFLSVARRPVTEEPVVVVFAFVVVRSVCEEERVVAVADLVAVEVDLVAVDDDLVAVDWRLSLDEEAVDDEELELERDEVVPVALRVAVEPERTWAWEMPPMSEMATAAAREMPSIRFISILSKAMQYNKY